MLALVAFGAVFLLGSVGGGGAIGGPSTTVVIAKQAIPLRHQITPADLSTAKISLAGNESSLANIYGEPKDVVNLIAQINISKGAVITSDMLAKDINLVPTGAAPAYLPLAKGYVAMTIPTGEQQGVAGHISVGDYITVIVSTNQSLFQTKTTTTTGTTKIVSKTTFTNLRIIGLGPASANVQAANSGGTTAQGNSATTGITSSLTVELTQCDAEFLTWFLNNTQVRYTLESFKDYGTAPTDNQDPACPEITRAGGVTQAQVEARYHFTAL
ncbi:MAG TPA: RcpC/CpaB family pilus assembly protein [Candidatus Dormibacteraeota bacterium]